MNMDEELARQYRRWLEADEGGAEEEADAACRAVFGTLDDNDAVARTFATRTMEAIAADADRTIRRARWTRQALTAAGVVAAGIATYFGSGAALSFLSTVLVTIFNVLINLIVKGASGAEAGADLWAFLGSLGYAASAFVADPKVTVVLLALQGLAVAALVTLQRLLGSDRESFK
jgi:phage shock protein PspC (stress-responsive transcriptional regulator)